MAKVIPTPRNFMNASSGEIRAFILYIALVVCAIVFLPTYSASLVNDIVQGIGKALLTLLPIPGVNDDSDGQTLLGSIFVWLLIGWFLAKWFFRKLDWYDSELYIGSAIVAVLFAAGAGASVAVKQRSQQSSDA